MTGAAGSGSATSGAAGAPASMTGAAGSESATSGVAGATASTGGGCAPVSFVGHLRGIESVAFSPDGAWLASASDDHLVKVWAVADGALARTLIGHTEEVFAVAFSPDGQTIATGSGDIGGGTPGGTIKLWRSDGILLRTLPSGWTYSLAFSPDGKTLASGHVTNEVRLWNVADGALLHLLTGHTDYSRAVTFTPDGKTVVSASWDSTIKLWDATAGTLQRTLQSRTTGALFGVAVSADGTRIVSGGAAANQLEVWSFATGEELVQVPISGVSSVALSPDGKSMVAGSMLTRLLAVADGSLVDTFEVNANAVAFSSDGRHVAAGDGAGALRTFCTP
jgi:WD40 repeat protein